jgi:hypothetical protein
VIHFKCPHCQKDIATADEHAGKKARCPGCKEIVVVPSRPPASKGTPPAPRRPSEGSGGKAPPRTSPSSSSIRDRPAPSAKSRPPRRKEDDETDFEVVEEDEELFEPEVIEEDEDDIEEEERPRPRKRRRRRRPRGEYADCPACGEPGNATRIRYTLWGGLIGPAMLCHVRCENCGTAYNGQTGNYNTVGIIIYLSIGLAIALGLGVFALMLLLPKLS